jgi:putative oxidoreductase
MSTNPQLLLGPKAGPRSVLLVRIAVGLIFLTQGILKYLDPNMGVVRFAFPHPYFTAHFVGTFEILCGFPLLVSRGCGRDSHPFLWSLSSRG